MIQYVLFPLSLISSLQELLAEVNHKDANNTACQKLWRLMIHGLAWVICIGSTIGCVLGIYYFSDYMHKVSRVVFMLQSAPVISNKLLINFVPNLYQTVLNIIQHLFLFLLF